MKASGKNSGKLIMTSPPCIQFNELSNGTVPHCDENQQQIHPFLLES